MTGRAAVLLAVVASAALCLAYLLAGGGSYEPTTVADPCAPREWRDPSGAEELAQQFALSALDGAACELGITRERLAANVATEEGRAELAAELGIDDATLEEAVRAGVVRAVDDAEAAGELGALPATALREVATRLPVDEAIAVIEDGGAFIEDAGDVLSGFADRLDGLLP